METLGKSYENYEKDKEFMLNKLKIEQPLHTKTKTKRDSSTLESKAISLVFRKICFS